MRYEILKTIELEGGDKYTNIPEDKGGETRFGISKRYNPDVDIKNLTLEEAYEIAERKYWNPLRLDEITSQLIRWKVFDIGFSMGLGWAARWLQEASGAVADGIIGYRTLTAVNNGDEQEIISGIIERQVKYRVHRVIEEPNQIIFLQGWINRAFIRTV